MADGDYGVGLYAAGLYGKSATAVTDLPTFILEVAFGSRPTDATYTWTDVSTRGRRVTYSRGRQHELDRTESGQGTATMTDADRYFDSTYTSSPAYPNVIPLVPVRCTAVIGSESYPMFQHYVESWTRKRQGPNYADREITTIDGFAILTRIALQPTRSTLTTTLGGNRDLTFTAIRPGAQGNNISIQYRLTSHVLSAPKVNTGGSYHGIIIDLGTTGFTANEIKTALDAHLETNRQIVTSVAVGSDGTGICTTMSKTNLAGGPLKFPAETSGLRVTRVLDFVDWPAALRATTIQRGITVIRGGVGGDNQSIVQAVTFQPGASQSALDHLQQTCGEGGEEGLIYIDGGGSIVFLDRWQAVQPPFTISQVTFSDEPGVGEFAYQDMTPSYDDQLIINEWTGTRGGGAVQTQIDLNSQDKYLRGVRQITSVLTTDDFVLQNLAWRLSHYKDPLDRVDQIKVMPARDTDCWAACLEREPGDRITVKQNPPGGGATDERDYIVQRIDADVNLADPVRTVFSFSLWPTDARNWLIMDNATYGRVDFNKVGA